MDRYEEALKKLKETHRYVNNITATTALLRVLVNLDLADFLYVVSKLSYHCDLNTYVKRVDERLNDLK